MNWHCSYRLCGVLLLGMTSLLIPVFAGCVLVPGLTQEAHQLLRKQSISSTNPLPPINAPANSIQLEILFVERPASDPTVSEKLWREIDEVGAAAPGLRQLMQQNGLRIGTVGASPPPMLQALLGMSRQIEDEYSLSQCVRRKVVVQSGATTNIDVKSWLDPMEVSLNENGKTTSKTFEQLQCVLKLRPHRLQDGWVRLDLIPELHHGQEQMRHTPTDAGWELRGGKLVETCYAQKFSVTLNTGEMAVASCTNAAETTLGGNFFGQPKQLQPKQKVLVVRFAGMHKPETLP
ncbi:hypothetical protein Spb1_30010 [Planctopirus ephydatiae]|uniref:Uncharacterized protein n=2 Tax=Planctopirus ephydatiae TaxID=2528019 RepID=A0A518GR55_9PLAN|nr:hypothetical protein Spb1_30010 [Planctopirus ephydatiae]